MPVYLMQKETDYRDLLDLMDRNRPGFKHFVAPRVTGDLERPEAAAYCGWSVSRLDRARRAWRERFPEDHIEIRTPRFEVQLLEKCTVSIHPADLDRLKEWWETRPLPELPSPPPKRWFIRRVPIGSYREFGPPKWVSPGDEA